MPDAIYDYGMMSAPDRIAFDRNPILPDPWKPVISVPVSTHTFAEKYNNGYLGLRGVGEKEPSSLFRDTAEGIVPLNYGEKRKAFIDEFNQTIDPVFKTPLSLLPKLERRCEHGLIGWCYSCSNE